MLGQVMFVCCVPRSSAEFSRVLDYEQTLFGRLSVPPEMAKIFFRLRPEIYQAVIAPDGALAAYSTVFPLRPACAEAFIAGEVTEPELTPEMTIERHESHEGATLYIGSVVVAEQYDQITKSMLLAALLSWRIKQLEAASVSRLSVILTPATKHGERMARAGGAKLLNAGINRKDGFSVCGREVTHGYLTRVAAGIERCLNGSLIEMRYNFPWYEKATPDLDLALPALS
jgi:hypothetical protein